MTPLEKLAAQAAIVTPLRRNKYVFEARIPWRLVEAIRDELERGGIDWRAWHKEVHAPVPRLTSGT